MLLRTEVPARASETFWHEYLRGLAPLIEVPLDRPRPARRTSQAATLSRRVSGRVWRRVRRMGRAEDVSAQDVALAAFAACLARHTGSTDIAIGLLPASSSRSTSDLVVMRLACHGEQTFRDLVRAVRARRTDLRAHGHLPFERLVDLLQAERDGSYHPIVQIAFARELVADLSAPFDLILVIADQDAVATAAFQYDPALYDTSTINRLLRRWQRLLDQSTRRPDEPVGAYDLLSPPERRRQTVSWNQTQVDWRRATRVQDAIAEVACRLPDAIAVTFEDEQLTYRLLVARAQALARRLREAGAGPNAPVCVMLDRSIDLVIAIVAILDAGAAYVPFDPATPDERLARLLQAAQPCCAITSAALAGRLDSAGVTVITAGNPDANRELACDAPPADAQGGSRLCYVLYTSGTTGEPKGVAVTHAAVLNLLYDFQRACDVTPADVVLGLAPLTFDIASLEVLLPLIAGARLALTPARTLADGADLRARLAREAVTVLQATPVTWRLLLNAGWQATPGMRLLCGSEPLPRELARELIATAGHVWNCYGPTETTIYSTFERLYDADLPITIGGPMANTSIYILDRQLQPVPVGVMGEIFLAGVGLARGYLGRPDLTVAAFVPDPFGTQPGQRMYASGDLGRFRPDGRIECAGRRDQQVKLHGRRIELDAITHVLDTHPLVQASAAVVRDDATRGRFIAAYVTSPQPDRLSRAELREHIASRLPVYMVPSAIVVIDALPRTARAKLDRRALPAPDEADFHTARAIVGPRTPAEQAVASVWCELLGLTTADIDENFFGVGGNSLLAAQLVLRLRDRLGVEIPVHALFDSPTIAELAAHVDKASTGTAAATATQVVVPRVPRDGALALSPLQTDWWRLEHFTGNINPNNVHLTVHLEGLQPLETLDQAFVTLVRRHEAFRTVFVANADGSGRPRTQSPEACDPRDRHLPLVDLSCISASAQRRVLDRLSHREQHRVFDLTRLPLWRLTVVRCGRTDHALVMTVQHLVCDAGSTELFITELADVQAALRRGEPARLPALPFEFVDFVAWQRDWLASAEAAAEVQYWQRQFAAPLGDLFPLSPADARYNGPFFSIRGRVPWRIGPEGLAAAQRIARESGATLFAVLTAALKLALFAETGRPDVRIGTLTPNRELPGADRVMGVFLNGICLRTHVREAMPFRTLVRGVHETIGQGMAHQRVPFENLSRAIDIAYPASGLLYQVIFIWLGLPAKPWAWPGVRLTADRRQPTRATKVMTRNTLTLRLELVETDTDLRGSITYNPARFSADAIELFASGMEKSLLMAATQPALTIDTIGQRLAQRSCSPS